MPSRAVTEFECLVEHGALPLPTRTAITHLLRRLEGKRIVIAVMPAKKKRTIRQNRFYFKYVLDAVRGWLNDNGYHFDAGETHEFVVRHIWKWTEVVFMPDGTPYERRLSSTRLSAAGWEEKIELVRQYGAEHGFYVPYPNEQKKEDLL